MLGSAESEMVRLISCEIIFAEYLNVTGRQTTCLGNTALRIASRGKNGKVIYLGRNMHILHRAAILQSSSNSLTFQVFLTEAQMFINPPHVY